MHTATFALAVAATATVAIGLTVALTSPGIMWAFAVAAAGAWALLARSILLAGGERRRT